VWAVNTDWALRNKLGLVEFARLYVDAVRWLYDAANRDKAVQILLKYARQSPKDAADSYDYYFSTLKGFSRDGLLSGTAYRKMTEGLIELGDLSPPVPPASKFFDDSFVRQATAQVR
jgi:ABC-type nitrate/sulfonate/bicarbonate transport system substrate-binding protein